MSRLFTTLGLLVVTSVLGVAGTDPVDYPTEIAPLPDEQLAALQQEFDALNGFQLCASLNQLGFPVQRVDLPRCLSNHPIDEIEQDESQLLEEIDAFIVKNEAFTNVTDAEQLRVQSSWGYAGCSPCNRAAGHPVITEWMAIFEAQQFQGLMVKDTAITVRWSAHGAYTLDGHWYRDVVIPAEDQFSEAEAVESLVGVELEYYGFIGDRRTLVITPALLQSDSTKAIVPFEQDDGLELRVAWEIGVLMGDAVGWYAYVDSTTGELVRTEQLFIS